MNEVRINTESIVFYELQWDTEYFGVRAAKAILHEPVNLGEWNNCKSLFQEYDFVTIENRNSEPENTRIICKDTSAYLVDVNVQFSKKINKESAKKQRCIEICHAMQLNPEIVKLAEFQYSRFIDDSECARRGGASVYRHWVMNSFEKSNKYFALSRSHDSKINGFILYSYKDNTCIIELISVANNEKNKGIGSILFKGLEYEIVQKGYYDIRVGTQLRNIPAINFYHKVGCRMTGCHQIFHLWN